MPRINVFKSYIPRWLVFLFDLLICSVSIILAYFIRFNFQAIPSSISQLSTVIPIVLSFRIITFLIFRSYAGLIRFTSARDTERIFLVIFTGSAVLVLINIIKNQYIDGNILIPLSVIIIDFFTTSFLMIFSRLAIKNIYHELINPSKLQNNVIIFGGDHYGAITKRTLDREIGIKQKVVAFIDNKRNYTGKKLEGINIYDVDQLGRLIERFAVKSLIISSHDIEIATKQKIIKTCLEKNVQILTVPSSSKWIHGKLSYNQIKGLKVEEILEREPIELDSKLIQKDLINKVIMVTGAAGSIGSEIARQICQFYPKKIILIDQAESPIYDLELELKEHFPYLDIEVMLADITNYKRLDKIFQHAEPDLIYHAAAYKHVPLIEENVTEAVSTNVEGTRHLAEMALQYNVGKFVFISTDKAVNPTNVMGASKRIAEIFVQSLNQFNKTKFVTTRFGNVLGSNGSVMPRFKKQIENGGPITITHPEITRYFMTIPEACQLVLEAGSMGKGGEIFIFDMGESVKIQDLAKNMVKLYGLTIGKDIQIKYTGLRPGEKLYEELLTKKENTISTYHPKIMIARVEEKKYEEVSKQVDRLLQINRNLNHYEIVEQMKYIVPEFKSKNSVFKELDYNNMRIIN